MAKKGTKKGKKKKSVAVRRRIGIIHSGTRTNPDHDGPIERLKEALAASGYSTTTNLRIIGPEYAGDDYAVLDRIARDMVNNEDIEVLVAAGGTRSAHAAQAATATGTPPVVFTTVREVNSYPSHMTGVCALTSALDPQRLEYLSMLTNNGEIGVLTNSVRTTFDAEWRKLQTKATELRVTLVQRDVPSTLPPGQVRAAIRAAFQAFGALPIRPVLVMADPFFNNYRRLIVEAATDFRTPAIYQWRQFVAKGGLMSYGTKMLQAYRIAGNYVGTILRTQGGTIPKIRELSPEFVINLGAAQAIGLTMPEDLLVLADEVIPVTRTAKTKKKKG